MNTGYEQWRALMVRFFPIYIACILLCIMSIAGAVSLGPEAFLRHIPAETLNVAILVAGLVCTLILVASNILLARGYPQAVVVNKTIALVCLAISAPAAWVLLDHPVAMGFLAGPPALALLLMTRPRYRELAETFRDIRVIYREQHRSDSK